MAQLNARQQMQDAERNLEDCKRAYLQRFGWESTCNTPGSYWLWRRDFAPEDAERLEQQEKHKYPTPPTPYGVITAGIDLAVSITERALDYEIDQDGDPETRALTLADMPED